MKSRASSEVDIMGQLASSPAHYPPAVNGPTAGPHAAVLDGNESDLRTLLDAIPQNVYLVNAEGTLLYLNRVALEYYGLPLEDFITGAAYQKAVHPDDFERLKTERTAGISAAVPFEYEARVRRYLRIPR